jgi:hypothetical protein
VTTVSEKVRDVTVMMDPEMACRMERAASGPPLTRRAPTFSGSSPSTAASKAGSATPSTTASATANAVKRP